MTPDTSCFQGYLSSFEGAIRPPVATPPADSAPCRELADPAGLAVILDRYAAAHDYQDTRAAASQWSKYFFSRLGIATLVTQMATGHTLDLRLDRMRWVAHDDGTPDVFILSDPLAAATTDQGHNFSSLIDDAFTPVVAALSLHCRLSARVFWSNAGVYFAWALGELESQQRVSAKRLRATRALISEPTRPDGGFNPFHRIYKDCAPGTLDGNDEPTDHCRRLCCMRDLDPQWGLCANCPRAMRRTTPKRAAI